MPAWQPPARAVSVCLGVRGEDLDPLVGHEEMALTGHGTHGRQHWHPVRPVDALPSRDLDRQNARGEQVEIADL